MNYLFDLKKRKNVELYFKMKNYQGYSFNQQEKDNFIKEVVNFIGYYDIIIYPQTNGIIIPEIANLCGSNTFCLQKNSKNDIIQNITKLKLMKQEKESLLKSFSEMNEIFQLKYIKGNQRKRFIPLLFKKLDINFENKTALIFDDAIFSFNTISSIKFHYSELNFKTIFSK